MADLKITQLTGYTPPIDTDVIPIVDITAGVTKKVTWANIKATLKTYLDTLYVLVPNIVKASSAELNTGTDDAKFATALAIAGRAEKDGWTPARETWAYASPNTITVPSGAASRFQKGDKWKLTANGVVLMGYIVGIADTVLTVAGDVLTNHTFTLNFYSHVENPLGFPDVFAFTPTWGGFSTNPTAILYYTIKGARIGFCPNGDSYGTSNAAGFTMTLPLKALFTETSMGVINVKNGSVNDATPGHIGLSSASATADLYSSFYGGAWTASGYKGFYCNWLWYEYTI